jgi:hypothetical protein
LPNNAGDYVCPETLYLSLTRANRPKKASRNRRPNLPGLIRAALIAILAVARKLRHDLAKHRGLMCAHHNFVKTLAKGPELDPALRMP